MQHRPRSGLSVGLRHAAVCIDRESACERDLLDLTLIENVVYAARGPVGKVSLPSGCRKGKQVTGRIELPPAFPAFLSWLQEALRHRVFRCHW